MLGKGVAGDVGFLQQREPGDATARELVPLSIAHGMQIHLIDETREQRAQCGRVRQRGGIAHVSFDDPFAA